MRDAHTANCRHPRTCAGVDKTSRCNHYFSLCESHSLLPGSQLIFLPLAECICLLQAWLEPSLTYPPAMARGGQHSSGQALFYRRGGRVQLTSPNSLDVSAAALGLSCYEVHCLEPFVGPVQCGESQRVAAELRDWPDIWALILDFGLAEVAFAVGRPQISRSAAEAAARREVCDIEASHGIAPRGATTVHEYIANGEPWAILYAPLTPVAFGILCQTDRSSEQSFETAVVELQRNHAWRLTITAALGLRTMPPLVRSRIFAFAFSAKALGEQ